MTDILYDYDEKRHLETVREEGENRIKSLAYALNRAGRRDELFEALNDDRKLMNLYAEFGIQ